MAATTQDVAAAPAADRRAARLELLVAPLVVVAGALVAVDGRVRLLGVAAAVAATAASLALRRFELLVLGVLLTRAGIDHLSGRAVSAGEVVVVILFLGAIPWWWRSGRPRPTSSLAAPFGMFLVACVASVAASDAVGVSARELTRIAAVGLMLVLLDVLLTRGVPLRWVMAAIVGSAVLPLLVAAPEALTGAERSIGGFARVAGSFSHPNPFAIYLALLLVTTVALGPHLVPALRWPLRLLQFAIGGCLILTYTRGAWIAVVAGLLVVGLLQNGRLLVGILAVVVVVAVAVPSVGARFADLDETEKRPSGATANSLVWRFEHWGDAIDELTSSPVSGIGLKMVQHQSDGEKNVHNDFLRVLVETGIVGFAAYLWLLYRMGGIALRALVVTRSGLGRGAAVAWAGGFIVLLIASVSANVITQVVLLWYFMALAVTAEHAARRAVQPVRPVSVVAR